MWWEDVSRQTGVRWLFTPASSQWRNVKAEAVVKSTKHALRTTFKYVDMDFIDFTTTLITISHMLNSRPVELQLGAYIRSGGGQELDSMLPDTFTAITSNDLLIGDGQTFSAKIN